MTLSLFNIIFITTAMVGVMVNGGMPGGLTLEQMSTPEVQEIIYTVKPQVEEELGRPVPQLIVLSYRSQVVAGLNYFAKVDIGEGDVAHLRVYKNLTGNVELTDMQYPKGRSEPLTYF